VLSKRRKIVEDMCEQLAAKARQAAQSEAWAVLRCASDTSSDTSGSVPAAVEAFLNTSLMALAKREAEHYNENAPLGHAIQEAVAMAEILDGWPQELQALAKLAVVAVGDEAVLSATAEELVRSEGALALSLEGNGAVPIEVVHGLCALLWARPVEASLSVDLSGRSIGAEGLAALGRAMTPTLTSLNLNDSNCANNGGDNSGIEQLRDGLLRSGLGLRKLILSNNRLDATAAEAICAVLKVTTTLEDVKYAAALLFTAICSLLEGAWHPLCYAFHHLTSTSLENSRHLLSSILLSLAVDTSVWPVCAVWAVTS